MGLLAMESEPAIYVTGFGPFGRHIQNASQVIVDLLPSTNIESELKVKLYTDTLSVSYEKVQDIVHNRWKELYPKLVVHIGVSDFAKGITLEKQAFNDNYNQLDIFGCLPNSMECIKESPLILETKFDLQRAVDHLSKVDSDVEYVLSTDPGRYLCGFVYYTSLSRNNCRSVFIHIPPLKTISYDVDEASRKLLNSITLVIKYLYKQVQENESNNI